MAREKATDSTLRKGPYASQEADLPGISWIGQYGALGRRATNMAVDLGKRESLDASGASRQRKEFE